MKAIIIDDERKSRSLLEELMRLYFPDITVAALAKNAAEGITRIRQYNPDVVFLDIDMPLKNGFEMLQELGEYTGEVIFVTAYNEYAVKAIRYNAFDYLLKPIEMEELRNCMERLQKKKKNNQLQYRLQSLVEQLQSPAHKPDFLTVHSMEGISVLPIADIMYLEASGSYTLFYCRDQEKIISSSNLKDYEELLAGRQFFRVHNSFLINMRAVRKYIKGDGGCVLMSNGDTVDVSKRRKEDFLKMLDNM